MQRGKRFFFVRLSVAALPLTGTSLYKQLKDKRYLNLECRYRILLEGVVLQPKCRTFPGRGRKKFLVSVKKKDIDMFKQSILVPGLTVDEILVPRYLKTLHFYGTVFYQGTPRTPLPMADQNKLHGPPEGSSTPGLRITGLQ